MQLYSVAQQRSQALEAHAAAFSTHQVPGNTIKSQIVAFAQKTLQPDGQITSKLHVIELGAQAAGFFCDAPFPFPLFPGARDGEKENSRISPRLYLGSRARFIPLLALTQRARATARLIPDERKEAPRGGSRAVRQNLIECSSE